ncbi:(Fe-S)-binding protein [[Mycobacterium] holstebronense]|uniref:(Fe-S)-binding protein n=1 Tax=[Mycobacterium] holstebronense TaxID=3064288 RepID=A0ABM9LCY3_9MYCO|nr:(Fe-S)-binding protein [Mycolicibacter sp. MU0102]CAJ1496908.1 (Fe-S)-binding protein [Mycolicibacter sp. MU0102]
MLIRLVVGLSMTGLVGLLAARRVFWLFRLVMSGQKVGAERTNDIKSRIETQLREVAGQAKLLKWNIPGIAHFFTMWAFFVLITVYIEAYGQMFNPHFAIPLVGHWDFLGFMQDFFITAVTLSIFVFMVIRVLRNPTEHGRSSRFYGSHNGGAWLILVMILNVVWTFLLLRGAAANTGTLPYGKGAYLSHLMGKVMAPLGLAANENIETAALLLHVAVALGFLLIVLNSKHLHIFLAPINVTFKRLPNALGPLLPIEYQGEPLDFDNPPEDAVFGRGKIDDFTWKGMLDFATCTECGRCQSQCPAWNTGKPLSPKLLIMDLRDHWMAKAPYLLGDKPMPTGEVDLADAKPLPGHHVPEKGFERIGGSGPEQAVRPLVGTAEEGGVIDPDVLWSCTNCGACVEQCPVDIEHIDHIVDMRRYQVLVESEFPSELGVLFKNLENKGNPWGQNAKERTSWIDELNFDIPVYGQDVDSFDGFEYLFWVGCAGAYEDRAKKTTKATAELLAAAGVKFLVLGTGETCTGDPARRAGNEFLFQQLASQNVEMLNEVFDGLDKPDRKIIASCPHCFNTISREYPQLGSEYTVLHHTQVLNRLVRDKRLIPVAPVSREVTYHDPCFLGRHNKVYEPPRELVEASGANLVEMPRNRDRSFCCGAGGARMWMEEHIGKRVNHDRVDEALATGATTIATGCPFCRVMVSDGIDDRIEASGRSDVDVRDIAQLLLESLDMDAVTLPAKGTAAEAAAKAGPKKVEEKAPAPAAVATATAEKPAAEAKAAAPVTGLGMAGGAKRPGAKKAAPAAAPAAEASAAAPAAPAAPVKGLGMAGGAKRPGAKKAAPAAAPAAEASAAAPAAPAEPAAPAAAPAAPVKGLGMAAGARKPGAKKAAPAAAEPAAAAAEPVSAAAEPTSTATEPAAAPEAAPEAAPAAEAPKEQPPVKGLGIQRGARPPGKR